jgi:hypothetical protein
VTVSIDGKDSNVVHVNEQEPSGQQSLGRYALPVGHHTTITVTNTDTDGYVVVDGVQLLRKDK